MAVRYMRDEPPSTYLLNIKPYSEFLKTDPESYLTRPFEAGGYQWRLIFYPGRAFSVGEINHISLYLRLHGTDSLPPNWEVKVELKLFIKNQTQNKFLIVQDNDVKRFDGAKTQWGYDEMLPHSTFNDSSNGYLVNDSCIVGADVFVVKPSEKQENLTFFRNPTYVKFTWKIAKFSKLDKDKYESDEFVVGENKWKLSFHPRGHTNLSQRSDYIAIQLWLVVSSAEDMGGGHMWKNTKLRLLDQINSKHVGKSFTYHYPQFPHVGTGNVRFLRLEELNDPSRGFLVNDKLIVELDTELISVSKIVLN